MFFFFIYKWFENYYQFIYYSLSSYALKTNGYNINRIMYIVMDDEHTIIIICDSMKLDGAMAHIKVEKDK